MAIGLFSDEWLAEMAKRSKECEMFNKTATRLGLSSTRIAEGITRLLMPEREGADAR